MLTGRLFPIRYDAFKAMIAILLLLLLWWWRPHTNALTIDVAVDPSGIVTLSGEAPTGRQVHVAVQGEGTFESMQRVQSDDNERWLTSIRLAPGHYTARADIGSAKSDRVDFEVPQPAKLAPLILDPTPTSLVNPVPLSGRAEPGEELLIFIDGKRVPMQAPVVAGTDGLWQAHVELPPGGHTVTVAYATSPDLTSDPLTIELHAAKSPAPKDDEPEQQRQQTLPGPSTTGHPYIVRENDWLSKLAADFLGDPMRYTEIREATNAKAAEDASFSTIEDDHLIYPGEKIWIPAP